MKKHLTEGEIWTLRYIDVTSEHGYHQATLRAGKWVPDLPPSLPEAKEPPVTAEEAVRHAQALEDYGLVEALTWHTGGGELKILGAGREWLWDHDHPNRFAAIWERACRNKVTAWLIALYFIIGATGGIISLSSDLISLALNIKSLFGN